MTSKEWDKERDPETASQAVKEYLATLDDGLSRGERRYPQIHLAIRSGAQWTGAKNTTGLWAFFLI